METQIGRIERDIEAISTFNRTPGEGITRFSFTQEYEGARAYIVEELKRIGAEVSITLGGNVRARLAGRSGEKPTVMMGSHLDSVPRGGRFDGVVGVVSAVEVARVIVEEDIAHGRPIDVVVFAEEEGGRFGLGMAGTAAWIGKLRPADLRQLRDKDGVSYQAAMEQTGTLPEDDSTLRPGMVKAMLEVHIEQSLVLESKGFAIGIVEGIAGIKQFLITIEGVANHAGATPMKNRFDAMQGAARVIWGMEEIAQKVGENTVATVGLMECEPGVANVIPGMVRFSVDIRDPDARVLDKAVEELMRRVQETCQSRQLRWQVEPKTDVAPITLSEEVADVIERAALERGIQGHRMISGALHDSSIIAQIADVGMIFVPSKGGRSHCPEESSDLRDIKKAADILLGSVVKLSS